MGSLLPIRGEQPKFAQLYVYDTDNEVQNKLHSLSTKHQKQFLDPEVVSDLIEMLDLMNPLTRIFRAVRDRLHHGEEDQLKICTIDVLNKSRQFDMPSAIEIVSLIVGDIESPNGQRDIIVELQCKKLQRLSEEHPSLMGLQYPLLFPYGEDGSHEKIEYAKYAISSNSRSFVTMREYQAYRLQNRFSEGNTLIRSGRLLLQNMVDAYTGIEHLRLCWIKNNQKKLRADLYNNICDAIAWRYIAALHKKIVLPSSFTRELQYMFKNYQDAMATCRCYGNLDLFITITANLEWPEIDEFI